MHKFYAYIIYICLYTYTYVCAYARTHIYTHIHILSCSYVKNIFYHCYNGSVRNIYIKINLST